MPLTSWYSDPAASIEPNPNFSNEFNEYLKLKKKSESVGWTKDTVLYDIGDYSALVFNDTKANVHFDETLKDEKLGQIIPVISDTHIGIEVEVERAKQYEAVTHKTYPVWLTTPDGSLRNHGVEFVSIPIKGDNVYLALSILKQELTKHCSNHEFSERTSIHVHVNVRDMSLEQLFVLLLTYIIVERPLFSFVDKGGFKRDKNIFCTPIQDSKDYVSLSNAFWFWNRGEFREWWQRTLHNWKKYTSFNMIPALKQGTVEFRHMGGTLNIPYLMDWINLILSIKKFAEETSMPTMLQYIEHMNTNSTYSSFLDAVFKDMSPLVKSPNESMQLEEGIIHIKEAIIQAEGMKITKEPKLEIVEFKKSSANKFIEKKGFVLEQSQLALLLKKRDELRSQYGNLKGATDTTAETRSQRKKKMAAIYRELIDIDNKLVELQLQPSDLEPNF